MVGKAAKSKNLQIRHGAFAALGRIKAKKSSKFLGKWLNPPKKFKAEIPPSYIEAIKAAGEIADLSTMSGLLKLTSHPELTIAESATLALGGYHTLAPARRKKLAFELIKKHKWLSAPPGRRSRGDDWERKDRLAGTTVQALQKLTGKKFQTAKGWAKWQERAERQKNPFE